MEKEEEGQKGWKRNRRRRWKRRRRGRRVGRGIGEVGGKGGGRGGGGEINCWLQVIGRLCSGCCCSGASPQTSSDSREQQIHPSRWEPDGGGGSSRGRDERSGRSSSRSPSRVQKEIPGKPRIRSRCPLFQKDVLQMFSLRFFLHLYGCL